MYFDLCNWKRVSTDSTLKLSKSQMYLKIPLKYFSSCKKKKAVKKKKFVCLTKHKKTLNFQMSINRSKNLKIKQMAA